MPYRFATWDRFLNATGPTEPNWRIYNLPLNGLAGAGAGVGNGFFNTAGVAVTSAAGQAAAQDRPHFVGNSYVGRDGGTSGTNPMTAASIKGTSKRQFVSQSRSGVISCINTILCYLIPSRYCTCGIIF